MEAYHHSALYREENIRNQMKPSVKLAALKGYFYINLGGTLARYFTENITVLAKDLSSATLDRFESAFKTLNKLLTA
jgi:hypothetical protein